MSFGSFVSNSSGVGLTVVIVIFDTFSLKLSGSENLTFAEKVDLS